jgi:Tfp pilus assembly protein PilO
VKFDLPRTSLFAAVLIVVSGYFFVLRPAEATVTMRYTQLADARTTLESSISLAGRVAALTRERDALDGAAVRAHVRETRAILVARFLHSVAAVALREGVAVENIAADVRQAPLATPVARTALFEELPFDLTLRGRYGDVIRAVRDLNSGEIATRITLASLSDADRRPGERPQLNAAFHVSLLREADVSTTHDVRSR